MKVFKIPNEEKIRLIKEGLDQNLSQSEIARMLGISRQLVRHWVMKIKEEKK